MILWVVELYCLLSLLYGFFINRNKLTFIGQLSQHLQKQDHSLPPGNNFELLAQTEKSQFQQTSIAVLTLCGIFARFVYSEIYYTGEAAAKFIQLFTGHNYHSDFALMTVLTTVEFLFFGMLLCYFTYRKFHKINQTPKILPPISHKLARKEKVFGVSAAGIIILLLLLTITFIFRGNYPGIALIIGILGIGAFVLNLGIKIRHKTQYLFVELLLVGVIFIVGYIAIVNSIDPSIISMGPPSEVYATGNLLSWGFIIVGCIAEIRLYLIIDDTKITQGGNNFGEAEK